VVVPLVLQDLVVVLLDLEVQLVPKDQLVLLAIKDQLVLQVQLVQLDPQVPQAVLVLLDKAALVQQDQEDCKVMWA
jgi:hypothetical protein